MHGAQTTKMRMSNQKARRIGRKLSRNTDQLKNELRTFCHPDVFGTSQTTSRMNTVVETAAIVALLRRCRSSNACRRARVEVVSGGMATDASERAPARERSDAACVAGERYEQPALLCSLEIENRHRSGLLHPRRGDLVELA